MSSTLAKIATKTAYPTVTAAALPASTTPTKMNVSPKGLPSKVVLILAISLPCVIILAILMGIAHYLLNRRRKKLGMEKGRDSDLDKQETRTTFPKITIDTNVPPARQFETVSPLSYALRSNTVACHPASLRPGTVPLSHLTLNPPYPATRSARPPLNRASTLSTTDLQRDVHLMQVPQDNFRRTMGLEQVHSSSFRPQPTVTLNRAVSPSPQPMPRTASAGAVDAGTMKPFPKIPTMRGTRGTLPVGMQQTSLENGDFGSQRLGMAVDVMGVRNPVQIYDPVSKRTIYHG